MKEKFKELMEITDIDKFTHELSNSKCTRCSLSQHNNRIVVYRGNPHAQIMFVGEAPGLHEDREGKAFVGPAGVLYDKIFHAAGIDTNRDIYNTNICKCRPVAKQGSGRQNYTPLVEQRTNCLPYVLREIELIKPKIVILAGLTAAQAVMGWNASIRMRDIAGNFFKKNESDDTTYFILYHPAHIIHAQKSGNAAAARMQMWTHVEALREKIDQMSIQLCGVIEYKCKFCSQTFKSVRPHIHQSGFVCSNCWDERLRTTG